MTKIDGLDCVVLNGRRHLREQGNGGRLAHKKDWFLEWAALGGKAIACKSAAEALRLIETC